MTIDDHVQQYMAQNITLLLDEQAVEKCFIQATREYQAWSNLEVDDVDDNGLRIQVAAISGNTDLTVSEWGIIQVLAHLFCERENALIQESSRVASHEPYGRSSAEVESDIHNFRNEHFRMWAFKSSIISV